MNLRAKFRILAGQFRERFDRALSVIGYRFVKEAALTAFPVPTLIEHLFSNGEEVFFLQIGANDGVQGDHLTRFRGRSAWSGLLLEPNPVVFSRLAKNVAKTGNPRVQALQVALADKDAILPFFVVDDEKKRAFASLPQATDTWSSLSRETLEGLIRKYGVPLEQAAGLIAEIPVKALTFESLIGGPELFMSREESRPPAPRSRL